MKPTPTERAALAKAKTITPLTLEEASALRALPDLLTFARRHDRVRLAATLLVAAADDWRHRELRLALYRRALRAGDRADAFHLRVTALDAPTARLRADLLRHYLALVDAEAAAWSLL
jgi:hypothetical protein